MIWANGLGTGIPQSQTKIFIALTDFVVHAKFNHYHDYLIIASFLGVTLKLI